MSQEFSYNIVSDISTKISNDINNAIECKITDGVYNYISEHKVTFGQDYEVSLNPKLIIEAIKKATPTQPYYEGTLTSRSLHCKTCNGKIFSTDNYCRHCGQKQRRE